MWSDTLYYLQWVGGLFVDLGCCLSDRGEPWSRTHRPFHCRVNPEWAAPAFDAASADYVCLANNHVLDYEEVALRDTLDEPDDAGIARSGAGRALDEALEPAVVSTGSATVAIVAFTDNAPEYAVGCETARNRSGRRSTA